MGSSEKKGENFSILREIYNDSGSATGQKKSFWKNFRKFFDDEKRLNRLLSVAVLFFGISGALVGLVQIRSHIFFKPKVTSNKPLQLGATVQAEQDLLGLRNKDTDRDELSDYDELYLYGTSPYIQDSDSDGVSDKREVSLGTDPTCSKSGSCFRALNTVLSPEANSDRSQNQSLYVDTASQLLQLRKALSLSGMSEQDLAGLSDEQLIALYQEALAQNTGSGSVDVSLQGVTDLSQLTPVQIRSILKTAGISDEILSRVSDEDLLELMRQVTAGAETNVNTNSATNVSQ